MTLALRQVHVGDCRELLAKMADESVNCVVTSPPYYALRDYGTATWDGGDPTCAHAGRPKPRQDTSGDGTFHSSRATQAAKAIPAVPVRSVCVCVCGAARIDQQLGLEETPGEYVEEMVDVFREVRRVLRSDGVAWINLGDGYAGSPGGFQGKNERRRSRTHAARIDKMKGGGDLKPKDLIGIPWMVAFALRADGWWLRMDNIWSKPNPMPESVTDRPTKAHEYMFLLSKSATYYYDAEAIKEPVTGNSHARGHGVNPKARDPGKNEQSVDHRKHGFNERWKNKQNASFSAAVTDLVDERNKRSVWTIATEPYQGAHFATFPTGLVEPCILAGCPPQGVVLDPFGGSGTVGEVAEALGRNWILLELNPAYAELARKRTAQRGLFVDVPAVAVSVGGD